MRQSQYRKAASRNEIYAALAELWETTPAQAETRYHRQYRPDLAVIRPMLKAADCHIGYGQEGDAPPWPGIAKPVPTRPNYRSSNSNHSRQRRQPAYRQ